MQKYGMKLFGDARFLYDLFGIMPNEVQLLKETEAKTHHPDRDTIDHIQLLILEYPHIPQLMNLLSVAYMNMGKPNAAKQVNRALLKKFPQYLYARLNLASEYLEAQQLDEVESMLGKNMTLPGLYPRREGFHIEEFMNYEKIVVLYFLARKEYEVARSHYDMAKAVSPEHPIIDFLESELEEYLIQNYENQLKQLTESSHAGVDKGYDTSIQTDEPPEFVHEELAALYEYGFEMPQDIIERLLSLPRESLISDLETVLKDCMRRFEYYQDQADLVRWEIPTHALSFLAELKAYGSLEIALDLLRQGEVFLDFWFDDFLNEELWEILVHLCEKDPGRLIEFVWEPHHYTFARSVPSMMVAELIKHDESYRAAGLDWYRELFKRFIANPDDESRIDTDLIGLMVCALMDLNAKALLPEMETLFSLGLVAEMMTGDWELVQRHFREPQEMYDEARPIFTNIEDRYQSYQTLYSHSDEFDDDIETMIALEDAAEPEDKYRSIPHKSVKRKGRKIGRNEPCPCGSGKKFKKCCAGKKIYD